MVLLVVILLSVVVGQRPPPQQRRFVSAAAVRGKTEQIVNLTSRLADATLATMFQQCYPNTLDTNGMQAAGPRIDTYKFFKYVFGFSEKTIDDVVSFCRAEETPNGTLIHSPGGVWRAGLFRVLSVNDLRAEAAQVPPAKRRGTMNIINGNGIRSRNFAAIDVGALQMDPANRGALFQVASNFNCLEFISSSDSARRGITKYVSDHTQGPAASISCAPATLYRNYFVPHEVDGVQYIGQLDKQICLLRDVPIIPIKNGYVKFTKETLINLHNVGETFDFDAAVGAVRVGFVENAQVTSGMKTHELEMCTDPDQHVSQLFSAAMDLGGWGNPSDDPLVIKCANVLLKASYAATVAAAKINASKTGQNKCFLTLMGGGVFGNKPSWIVDAIAELKDEIIASGVDFHVVLFSGGDRELGERAYDRLEALVRETGGVIKRA